MEGFYRGDQTAESDVDIAIHDYKKIDEKILQDAIENHLEDLTEFARIILNLER